MSLPREALALSLQLADRRHRAVLPRHRVARWLRAALDAPAEIAVRVVDEEEGLRLNAGFRGQAHATNVLTFPYDDGPRVVADLVLCAPVVAREAAAGRIPLAAHYAHLVVHGALHAQGHDHLDDAEASAMEARETAILARLGYPDPYAAEGSEPAARPDAGPAAEVGAGSADDPDPDPDPAPAPAPRQASGRRRRRP